MGFRQEPQPAPTAATHLTPTPPPRYRAGYGHARRAHHQLDLGVNRRFHPVGGRLLVRLYLSVPGGAGGEGRAYALIPPKFETTPATPGKPRPTPRFFAFLADLTKPERSSR